MTRPATTTPLPALALREDATVKTQTRRYRLITPLFGGGVQAGVADPVTPVRGSVIRGHLRFWWRACRGGAFDGNLQRMKEAEDRLWGAASTSDQPRSPDVVEISVSDVKEGQPFAYKDAQGNPVRNARGDRIIRFFDPDSPYGYVAFPFQDRERNRTEPIVREGVEFSLTVRYRAADDAHIHAALWAWETFGGLGARTRRGFGALQCVEVEGKPLSVPDAGTFRRTLRANLEHHVEDSNWPANVPHLRRDISLKMTSDCSSPLDAWTKLIAALKDFRQNRNRSRTGRQGQGRSRWPEPDEIRRLTGQASTLHSTPLSTTSAFPRAAFGLPVTFSFKDSKENDKYGTQGPPYDPDKTALQGQEKDGRKYERLASSLILRPVQCGNGKAFGLALLLDAPRLPPGGVVLKGAPGNPVVRTTLTPAEAAAITQAIPKLKGNPDILKAFLDSLGGSYV